MSGSVPEHPKAPSAIVVTVGPSSGMFRGSDHFAIQGALDYAARFAGATVEILPGEYLLYDALRLPSQTTLRGHGSATVLRKAAASSTTLAVEAVWYERSVETVDARGFHVGMGISIDSPDDATDRRRVSRHTILAIEGNTLHLDRAPGCDHRPDTSTRVHSVHSLLDGIGTENIVVCDLALEGNSGTNPPIRGDYAAPVFFRDARRARIERLVVRDWNGDGISWQTADDVLVSDCLIENITGIAIHPGSGSSRSRIAGTRVDSADIGIYWCWGVTRSSAEGNSLNNCRTHGTSLGYRDTDIALRGNSISRSGQSAIQFREEGEDSAHRAVVEGNTIDCRPPGSPKGVAPCAGARNVVVRGNTFLVASGREADAFDRSSAHPTLEAEGNTFNASGAAL